MTDRGDYCIELQRRHHWQRDFRLNMVQELRWEWRIVRVGRRVIARRGYAHTRRGALYCANRWIKRKTTPDIPVQIIEPSKARKGKLV